MFEHVEGWIVAAVQWLTLLVELVGALVIALGVWRGLVGLVRAAASGQSQGFNRIRLELARYLALALEFQLAADILHTAVAPSWERIGQLAAIAAIRTALNHFLRREMHEEEAREGGA